MSTDELRLALEGLAGIGASAARPEALLRTVRSRVRRRRALKQAGIGVTTLVVGGGLTFSALQLFPPRGEGPLAPAESPSVSASPGTPNPSPPVPVTPPPSESPSAPPAAECSAAGQATDVDLTGLPLAVQNTVRTLAAAAATCDDEALITLAESFGTSLTFGGRTAREEWQLPAAEQGEPVYAILLHLLTQTHWAVVPGDVTVWPRVYAPDLLHDAAAWQEAVDAGAVPADLVQAMRDGGSYQGWRLGIAADGTWKFYVGGD